ncbi:MAG: hypothetical protein IK104_07260 [Clostridia bacterium]|nr:hypothetical protein [Clostridia bacterium]
MFRIEERDGAPALCENGKPVPAFAYMTYLPERGRWADFAAAGYRLFSLPVLFAGKSISMTKGLMPFGKGIFDGETPDFSGFDGTVERILGVCPDALLLPRVNVSLPDRWLDSHPEEADATGAHESLCSPAAAAEAARLLTLFLAHVKERGLETRIAGYHLAGGATEEWFHFDMDSNIRCPAAEKGFREYLKNGNAAGEPEETAYLLYRNDAVTHYIAPLASTIKRETGGAPVGVFYGYSLEVTSPAWGTHALGRLLNNPDIDFICSPNSYMGLRDPAADWTEMFPAASVRLHGKLAFQECDIRTHLTRLLNEVAPAYDPGGALCAPVWRGPADPEMTRYMMRKTFCRQLIMGNGAWWFDMWGGWYADKRLMEELARMREIYEASLAAPHRESVSEVAVFTDETSFSRMRDDSLRGAAFEQRRFLGLAGAPCDYYDLSDFDAVKTKYKAAVFSVGCDSGALTHAVHTLEAAGVPYLKNSIETPVFGTEELRAFYQKAGVHLYADAGDIVYVNAAFIAVCALTPGEKTLSFPKKVTLADLFDGRPPLTGETVTVPMKAREVSLFRIGTA